MSPTIAPGSYLLFHHLISHYLLKIGKIVKVQHPHYGLIVKRIVAIDDGGDYWLEGLNADSVTRSEMGTINKQMITGILLHNIKKPK